MMDLDSLLQQLGEMDSQLTAAHARPAPEQERTQELSRLLEQRAALVAQAVPILQSTHSATPRQREQLLASEQAGDALLRRLAQTRHQLAEQLRELGQEQRLWAAMTASGLNASPGPHLDCKG